MKIRILDSKKMGILYIHKDGDIVEVYRDGPVWRDDKKLGYEPRWINKYFEFVEEKEQEDMHGYKEAWQTVWDSICKNCPEDLWLGIMTSGTGIENAVEFVEVMSRHYKEAIKEKSSSTLTLEGLQDFTTLNKDIEISFEAGRVLVRDWSGSCDPIEHAVDSLEDLEEVIGAFEVLNNYRRGSC